MVEKEITRGEAIFRNSSELEYILGLTFISLCRYNRSRRLPIHTRDGIAAARRRGRSPGRPPLDSETVSATQKLIEGGLSAGQAAKQLGIGRATAYRIADELREEPYASGKDGVRE